MKKSLFFFGCIFLFSQCRKSEDFTPCIIDPLNGNWEHFETGDLAENELNLPFGFLFSVTPAAGDEYEISIDGQAVVLTLQKDEINAPELNTFIGGMNPVFHAAYTIENDTMDLWFSSPYGDGLGTSIYKLINVDCP